MFRLRAPQATRGLVLLTLGMVLGCHPGPVGSAEGSETTAAKDTCGDSEPAAGAFCFDVVEVTGVDTPTWATDHRWGGATALAVAHGLPGQVSLLTVSGSTVVVADQIALEVDRNSGWMASGDIDGDGLSELVINTSTTGSTVKSVDTNETGFGDVETLLGGALVLGSVLLDTDGDAQPELLAGTLGGGELWVYENGSWEQETAGLPQSACGGIAAFQTADLDGNGSQDVVFIGWPHSVAACSDTQGFEYDPEFHTVVSLTTDGATHALAADAFASGTVAGCLALGDFDGDDIMDLAVGPDPNVDLYDVYLHRGLGDGTFALPVRLEIDVEVQCPLAAGDFDGDGKAELWLSGDEAQIVDNVGGSPSTHTQALAGAPLAVSDFNGDGTSDLAVRSPTQVLTLLLSNP